MKAEAIMRQDYESLRPDDTLRQAAERMVASRFYALPVLDGEEHLLGVLTAMDIIALALPAYLDEVEDLSFLPGSFELPPEVLAKLDTMAAADWCRARKQRGELCHRATGVHHDVGEDESILEVARLFAHEGVLKCPVVREGKVVGMIDPQDLLQAIIGADPGRATQ